MDRLLRTSQGLLSEQAGVVAEIENSAPKGRAAARRAVDGGGGGASAPQPWSLRLFDVYTCSLSAAAPSTAPAGASCPSRSRCSDGRVVWWVVLEAADDGQRGSLRGCARCQLARRLPPPTACCSLIASSSRTPASRAGGGGGATAAAKWPSSPWLPPTRRPPRRQTARRLVADATSTAPKREERRSRDAMRGRTSLLGAASRRRDDFAPTPARTEIVDLMGGGPDGRRADADARRADGGGGAVDGGRAAAASSGGGAGGGVGRSARERRPRALRRAGAAVGRGRRVGARAARALPARRGAPCSRPALLLEDVTGRLNTEDDMTFCEVRLRSCHADDAPGSAAAASAAATAASSATAMTATAVAPTRTPTSLRGGVPNLSAPAAAAAVPTTRAADRRGAVPPADARVLAVSGTQRAVAAATACGAHVPPLVRDSLMMLTR